MLLVTSIYQGFATLFHTTSLSSWASVSVCALNHQHLQLVLTANRMLFILLPFFLFLIFCSAFSYWVFILILFPLFSGYTISNQCFYPDPSFIQYVYTHWHLSVFPFFLQLSLHLKLLSLSENETILKRIAVKHNHG